MNFDDAIKAHADWKMKLSGYIRNPDKSVDYNKLAMDNQCELGKWLYSEGQKYKDNADFAELIDCHKHFHKAASNIVQRADKGEKVQEETSIGANSEFASYSTKVVSILMKFKREIKQ